MRTLLLLAATLVLALPRPARAFREDSLPLTEDERFQRFPQQHLYSEAPCAPGTREVPELGPRGVRFEQQEGGPLVLRGEDSQGRPFRVALGAPGPACSLYRADLDKSGTQDLVLVSPTGGRGLAPTRLLRAVLFDEAGRPVPWQVEGYFEEDEHGVADVLDLDGDGRAELVRQARVAGTWLTSLYKAEGGHWRRVQGPHGERNWPLISPKGRTPFEEDLSNLLPASAQPVRLAALASSGKGHSRGAVLTLEGGRRCTLAAPHSALTVVVDRPGGREVALLGVDEGSRALARELIERKLPLLLTGQRRQGTCSPGMAFVQEPVPEPPASGGKP
jgi:hypothetical protein